MEKFEIIQLLAFIFLLTLLTKPLGIFIAKVFQNEKTFLSLPLGWMERFIYRLSGVKANQEMTWKDYALAMMAFNVFGILFVFVVQLAQNILP